ncbi:MAG: DUF3592 domain-containing protein [Oscillospiraceae bacterium]|nr:DUF3592 domain-containing protein [Oscillospiraceae bacterium]
MQLLLWLPVILAVCSIAAAFLPVRKGKIAHPVYTVGTVVGTRRQQVWRNRSETESLAPVVRYETESGEITAASRHYVPEWQYARHTGDQVKLCYDRTQPDVFALCDEGAYWRKTVLLTFGIGTLAAYGILWGQYILRFT